MKDRNDVRSVKNSRVNMVGKLMFKLLLGSFFLGVFFLLVGNKTKICFPPGMETVKPLEEAAH